MSEWKERTVDELCTKITDGSHFSPQEVEVGFPMFSVKDMEQNGFSYKSVKKISNSDFKKLEKGDCKPLKNDILIAKDGSYLKHVFVCREERDEVILSSIAILRPDIEKINPDFLKYILSSPSVKNMMANYVSGVAIPRIILNDFKRMTLYIPSKIQTQQKIANILSTYDELIEVNNERIRILEETAQSLYKEWFVRFRFPNYQDTEFIKGVPKGWGVIKFRDFIKLNRGFDLPNDKIIEGEFPVIASTSTKAFHNEYKSSGEGIITGRSGSLGVVQYINGKYWALNTALYVKDFKGNFPKYVYYFLKEMHLENFDSGAGVPTLNQNHLHGLRFPLPSISLQKQFDEIVSPMFTQIETLQQQNTELRQIRDRLLPRLISGKIVV